jgi:Na+/H+ antiporter NhaD/arsenite permease-like protein
MAGGQHMVCPYHLSGAALQNLPAPLSQCHAELAKSRCAGPNRCGMLSLIATLTIILAALAGILLRPFGLREAVPALAGAAALVLCGLIPLSAALRAAGQGWNVYLFLAGMMLLAELALAEGVFDWAAKLMARAARGSALRLFCYVYALAVLITVILSNDATAVVFTPAVAAMARLAGAKHRLPYLLICAFVANAASFVLPIANPANLVVYGAAMPDLAGWLALFALPSAVAIAATFLLLLATQWRELRAPLTVPAGAALDGGGRLTLAGLGAMAIVLLAASAQGWPLGPPAFAAGAGVCRGAAARPAIALAGAARRVLERAAACRRAVHHAGCARPVGPHRRRVARHCRVRPDPARGSTRRVKQSR